MKTFTGFFLRKDLEYLVNENFAKEFHLDLDAWLSPVGYYGQADSMLYYHDFFPDGVYLLLGSFTYPGREAYKHIVIQFNILKSQGKNLTWVSKFNGYPDFPQKIPFDPIFPLFKVGELKEYEEYKALIKKLDRHFSIDELQSKIWKEENEKLRKLYKLRLACVRYAEEKF